jgi:hypothetical protein
MDQLKDDWKSEDSVWYSTQKMVWWRLNPEDGADTNFLLYKLP